VNIIVKEANVRLYRKNLCIDISEYCKRRKITLGKFISEIINAEFTNYDLFIKNLRTTGAIYLDEYSLYIQPYTLKTQLKRRGYNTIYDPQRNKIVLCETNMPKNWTKNYSRHSEHPYSQQG
jgi:hypothetical protein